MILKNERYTRGSLKAVVVRQQQKPRATFLLNLTCTATTPKGSKSHGARAARCASHSLDTLHAKPFHRGSVAEDEHRECVPLTLTFIPDWMTPQHLQHGWLTSAPSGDIRAKANYGTPLNQIVGPQSIPPSELWQLIRRDDSMRMDNNVRDREGIGIDLGWFCQS